MKFLEEQQTQWPMGKLETLHQAHTVALGDTLAHPLQGSDFLTSAGFIQLTISRPKSHTLPLAETREFAQKVAAHAPEEGHFGLTVEDCAPEQNAITVRILAARWSD